MESSESIYKRVNCCGIKSFISSKFRKVWKKSSTNSGSKTDQQQLVPQSERRYNSDDYDYVQEEDLDKISGESISLYQCEMPEEKIKKLRVR